MPALLHQLFMRSKLNDSAVRQYNDEVGAPQRAQAMCHNERRPPAHGGVHGVQDLVFRFRIDRGQCIVADQDGRLQKNCPRNGQPLPLSAGQIGAVLADDRVVTMRQRTNKLICRGDSRCAFDLVFCCVRMTKGDVRRHRIAEQKALLKHNTDAAAQYVQIEMPQVNSIDRNTARAYVVKPRKQVHQRALARAPLHRRMRRTGPRRH